MSGIDYLDLLLPTVLTFTTVGRTVGKAIAEVAVKGGNTQGKSVAKNQSTKSNRTEVAQKELTDQDAYEQISQKPQAKIIKFMMDEAKIDIPVLARFLNCQPQSLRNKFNRDSFSIDDLVVTAYACGFNILLKKDGSTNEDEDRVINPETYLKSRGDDAWDRIFALKNKDYVSKRAEYDELKARLAELDKEFQFGDQK